MSERWASVIINNYNYGRFLGEAIESALGQTYQRTEVIVVDDGSTDRSREVIAEYAGRVTAVLKDNGGQASTCNAGFAVSRGDVVIFLDADDLLLPAAIETALPLFDDPGVVQVHWPLLEIDEYSNRTGNVVPKGPLAEGDLRDRRIREGPFWYETPPTSGSAWARHFLAQVLPIRESACKHGVDGFLVTLAPVHGLIGRAPEPQGWYRRHSENFTNMPFEAKVRYYLWRYDQRCVLLSEHLRGMGIDANAADWQGPRIYLEGLLAVLPDVAALIPAGKHLVLVDQGQLGAESFPGYRVSPFLERGGLYWGPPPDDATAIRELERLRRLGAKFIVFCLPALWWLEWYSGFGDYLRSTYHCVQENGRAVIFDLTGQRTVISVYPGDGNSRRPV
jgi:glycosyltransferase involved in cell wall biosynthesis